MTEKKTSQRSGSRMTVILLGVTLVVALLFAIGFGGVVYYLQRDAPAKVSEGSFLHVPLSGAISDAPTQGGLFAEPEDFPPTATEIAAAIRAAADDERVRGVYLTVRGPEMGWALAREIRTSLVALEEKGKPCVAFGELYTMRDYYVASACSQVLIAPGGVPIVAGQALSVTYYRDALTAIGVEPRFVWVGDYKTAVEPYQRMEPSEAAMASYEYLLDGLWTSVVEEIAASRGMSVEQLQAVIDRPSLSPQRAASAGLFDGVAYEDAVLARLPHVGSDGWIDSLADSLESITKAQRKERLTSLKEYRKSLDNGRSDARIAVIYAEGSILPGHSEGGLFGSSGLFDGDFHDWMADARQDDSVKAVVVRVNSPGGAALAADNMHREVALTRAAGKPVVISMADYAASGGYMMSAGADWIVAQPTTITGSIGVFGTFFDLRGTFDKLHMATHVYKRGERADLMYTTSEQDEGDREVLQEFVQDTYTDFVQLVADGRKQTPESINEVAQGRVWTGTQAIGERGLVDELGGLDEALAKARDLVATPDAGIVRLPEKKGFIELFVEEMNQTSAPKVQVEIPLPGVEQALDELALLQAFHAAGGAVVYLPGHPTLR